MWRPWPYAATAIVQWEWIINPMFVWVTFRYPMEQGTPPFMDDWDCQVDGANKPVVGRIWQDEFTLLLKVGFVNALPNRVTLEYLGPTEYLRTAWGKQWEPWGPILAYRAMGAPYTGTKTHSAEGPTDNVDVTDIGILFIDCSANDVTIGGFVGGINGQILRIAKTCTAAHDVTMEHEEGTGNQDMHLHAGIDETLRGEYGGWLLVCDGSAWYDISHAKHV